MDIVEVYFTKNAEKSLKKLDKIQKIRIVDAIHKLPCGDIKRLQGIQDPVFRLRVGDYRIIYIVKDNVIYINDILPRGSAYKRI